MFRPRIIPVLQIRDGALVKSVQFKNHRYIGDPINAVRIFNDFRADEIIILDIDATNRNSVIDTSLVREISEEANMPFSVGGGVNSIDQIYKLLRSGAEKVVINSAAIENPSFVRQAADNFGSSTIVVCIDVKKSIFGNYKVYSHRGRKTNSSNLLESLAKMEEAGAGEIIIQSVDQDGMMRGYDHNIYRLPSRSISVPILALGGAGSIKDVEALWRDSSVNGFCGGSIFVYWGKMNGVLINYPKHENDAFQK